MCTNIFVNMLLHTRCSLASLAISFQRHMLKLSGHSGVQGYIIKNIKNQINSALQVRSNKTPAET